MNFICFETWMIILSTKNNYSKMGCWSYPITTRCYDKNGNIVNPDDVILDFTGKEYLNNSLCNLEDHGMIVCEKITFEKSSTSIRIV